MVWLPMRCPDAAMARAICGTLTDVAADEEEGGADVVAGEDFEKALGDDVVGAVVVGECDFVGVAAGDKDVAEELGLRGESGVGAAAARRPAVVRAAAAVLMVVEFITWIRV